MMTTATMLNRCHVDFVITILLVLLLPSHLLLATNDLPKAVTKHKEMVVTTNPLASKAGAAILRKGGTAADAMVAVQAVLGLVEPHTSGLGGGAFVVYYDAHSHTTTTVDGREKATSNASEDRFSGMSFVDAWQSGLSVGVPGIPRLMEYVQHKYGRLHWKRLFRSAQKLAIKGFKLTEQTTSSAAAMLSLNSDCSNRRFFRDPTAFAYFAKNCTEAKPAGTKVKNIQYAKTLKKLAKRGANTFYHGKIARDIVSAVKGDLAVGGDMTVEDLANYDVVERDPVCIKYRGHNVCGMGPPSSGALAVGQIMGILESFDFDGLGPLDLDVVHQFTQAGRLAFADRGQYVGDSDFVSVPVEGMLDKTYLKSRADMITEFDMGQAEAGVPPGVAEMSGADSTAKNSGTSHISIVDRWGNALSMTTTIENFFGNGVMVDGFLLNNELTDFAFSPVDSDGMLVANRVEPNKRPRSSMSPTIVFNAHGKPKIITGSPGGSRIIGYTAQSIMNIIDFSLDPQEAINVPHFMNRNGRTDIEAPVPGITLDYDATALAEELKLKGHSDPEADLEDREVGIIVQKSGLSIIEIKGKKKLVGGADNRRDNTVAGR